MRYDKVRFHVELRHASRKIDCVFLLQQSAERSGRHKDDEIVMTAGQARALARKILKRLERR
jgi:hypothetical protein